jgi:Family of unknown function (DUF5908)
MPVIINEILIRSTVENASPTTPKSQESASANKSMEAEELVKQAVEKVLEILEEKKQR